MAAHNQPTHRWALHNTHSVCSWFSLASLQVLNGTKTYLRPLSSAVVCQSQALVAQNTKPVALLPQVRSFQTSPASRDIDSAAKFIGAGAATVGVAGSGTFHFVDNY